MTNVTALRTPEQLALITLRSSFRRIDASGIDGMWLREQLTLLYSDRAIDDLVSAVFC